MLLLPCCCCCCCLCRLRIFELFPVLLGILLSWFIAWLLTIGGVYNSSSADVQAACRTDQSTVLYNSPWFKFPYPGQWGPIQMTWASTLTMLAGETPASSIHSTFGCVPCCCRNTRMHGGQFVRQQQCCLDIGGGGVTSECVHR
jgi:hypothetical protein